MRVKTPFLLRTLLAVAAFVLMLAACSNPEDVTAEAEEPEAADSFTVTYDGNGHSAGTVPIDSTVYTMWS